MADTTKCLGCTYSLSVTTDGETLTIGFHRGDYEYSLDEMEQILDVADALGHEDHAVVDGTTIYVETDGDGGITLDADVGVPDPNHGAPTVKPSEMREFLDEARDYDPTNLEADDPTTIRGFEIEERLLDMGGCGVYRDEDGDLWVAYKDSSHRDDNILVTRSEATNVRDALDEYLDD